MEMSQYTIGSVLDLHVVFSRFNSEEGAGFWFRGQADKKWDLLPSAARRNGMLLGWDLDLLREWSNRAIAYDTLPEELFEKMALAQHHGLMTRLLDWSKNPLVACFFAVCSEDNKDGAIYILNASSIRAARKDDNNEGVYTYIPRHISPRLINQGGLFTVHIPPRALFPINPCIKNANETNVRKLIIPKELKKEVSNMLDEYGISEVSIFPDLGGLSKFANRKLTKIS